jgi:hypothetical protein
MAAALTARARLALAAMPAQVFSSVGNGVEV